MSSSSTKRVRFDSAASSPSDSAPTPMAAARKSITASVESLLPEIASILSRLGIEILVGFHKLELKRRQVKKFADDPDYIPISARVKFALNGSKLVEQDAEYLNLAENANSIVNTFRKDIRSQIEAAMKLEVSKLQTSLVTMFVKNLRVAIKTLILCESAFQANELDKVFKTLSQLHPEELVKNFNTTIDLLNSACKREHSLPTLPQPFITEIPPADDSDTTQSSQPSHFHRKAH